jgi:hypothetical protein
MEYSLMGEIRLFFIKSDLLYKGALYDRFLLYLKCSSIAVSDNHEINHSNNQNKNNLRCYPIFHCQFEWIKGNTENSTQSEHF